MKSFFLVIRLGLVLILCSSANSTMLIAEDATSEKISFRESIRPILSDHCFACHGPDEAHREGGLRLDQEESTKGQGDSGEFVVVAGHPDQSELIARIESSDPDLQMPPASTNKPLTAEQQRLLKEWILQGANWERHWSLEPISKPDVPEDISSDGLSPIDYFIRNRLKAAKLEPSEQADPTTLLRRVTLDVTGFPPTPEEVESFLNDKSADAYAKVIDRLMDSPRYGEHQAHYWLDAARYGDTHGLHLDNYREMWPYRDWVIQAYNSNMPYDQFVIEQLAGDLLENATEAQKIATGFIRCHVTTSEGGSIREEVYVRNVVDRVNTFGTVFLGATFDCTRCHDHKFDSFTMQDYYSLFAYFNGLDGNPLDGNKKDPQPVIPVPNPEQKKQLADLDQQLATARQKLSSFEQQLVEAQKTWETSSGSEPTDWKTLEPFQVSSQGGATLEVLDDQSVLATGTNPAKEVYEWIAETKGQSFQTVRLEGLIDSRNSQGGAGRSSNTNVVLSEVELFVETKDGWQPVSWRTAWADYAQTNGDFKVENAIDGRTDTGWAIAGHEKKENRTAMFVTNESFGGENGKRIKFVMKHESVYAQHQFGRFRISVAEGNQIGRKIPENVRQSLAVAPEERNADQKKLIQTHFRDNVYEDSEYRDAVAQVNSLQKQREQIQGKVATTLVFKEKSDLVPSYILERGEYDQKGEEVKRRTPNSLPQFNPEWPQDRLGLAYWLVSPENPLTARVEVNRMWQHLFGVGLVKTSEDFGSQGEAPSHPELLDWLAFRFRELGWDRKALLKEILLSKTYQQSSRIRPNDLELDPENRLLARGPRFRLDAEMMRDQALYVSGLLVEELGGPSVKPPQPEGLWFAVGYTSSNTARFEADKDADKVHRRSLYTFIKRTAPAPQMSVLDGPSRESSCVRRPRTNTPLQVLLLLNDPQFVDFAIGLAARSMSSGQGESEILDQMFKLATCRKPQPEIKQALLDGFRRDLKEFRNDPERARKLVAYTQRSDYESLNPEELAAWTVTASCLLSSDEVVTKN